MTLFLLTLLSCQDGKNNEAENAEASALTLYPPSGGQGIALEVDLDADVSTFDFNATSVDFGEGIVVNSVTVDDGWNARASISIESSASLGLRDVQISTGSASYSLPQSFEVIAESFIIDPNVGKMGEVLEVGVLGANTVWESGRTWPNFGDGIEVLDFTVLTETLAQASISVSNEASPGWRNVTMDSGGGEYVVLYDGFKVDRVGIAATFEPSSAEQGQQIEFTVRARGTDFLSSTPQLQFYDRFGENPDIVVNDITVLDAENFYGRMTLSNAAALGSRDVLIETIDDSVRINDAFEVVGGDWDLSNVAIGLDFYVSRFLDPSTCQISESVVATAQFVIPLDPPCGGGAGQPPSGPQPYDNNGVFEYPDGEAGSGEDCPYPTTLGAGDYVWFESDANVVTLEKQFDSASGAIYYIGQNLTIDDYVPGQMYDLHTQGEEGGIGEYILEDVQPTVPADWSWISPDLCGLIHPREEEFPMLWTPAMTYPDAIFSINIIGTVEASGKPGFAGVLPWDDGGHSFTPDELSQLVPEPVSFQAYSYIQGPYFGFPESIYQENQSDSYIALQSSFTLE